MAGIELPTLVQRLVLDSTGFTRGAREATTAFHATTKAADDGAKKTSASWLKASQGLSDVGRAGIAIGAAFGLALGASVKAAADFEKEMRNVSSISNTVQKDFKRVSDQVLEMSRHLPQSATNLASGLYDIVSSGKDGAEAMVVLEESAKAASAGMTTTAVAAKGVSAVLNAYGRSGFEAAEVSDILFQTVNKGVLTFEELASNLGDFVGTAAILKVPIEDAASALATMTLSGINAAEASTALNRVFLSFIDPSDAMTAALKRNNFETGSAAIEALGLKGAMELLGRETGGSVEQMRALFPEVRGLKGALALLAVEGENYNTVQAAITSETERMGATQRAFNEQSKSFSFQLEVAKNNLSALGIEIGQRLLPPLSAMLSGITTAVNLFSDLPGPMKTVLTVMMGLTAGVGILGGSFLLLAPRVLKAIELFGVLSAKAPQLAAALGAVGKAAGWIGVVLGVAAIGFSIYANSQKEAKEAAEEFRVAVEQERQGLEGATDAAIKARLITDGLVGTAGKLGISYDDLTAAVKGNVEAMDRVNVGGKQIVGTIGQQSGALQGLNTRMDASRVGTIDFGGNVLRLRDALAAATKKVDDQEKATGLLMEVTGKTKKELIDLGLATETTGDKIEEAAQSIGLTSKVLARWGIDSEEAAKAFAKAIQGAMDATQKAFMKDFDVVAQFSASNWEKMRKDAESGSEAITAAEEKLGDARQNLSDLQDRLAEKTERSVSDNQQLAKAQEKVTEATNNLAEAQAKGSTSLGSMSEEIAKFYATSIKEAEAFNTNISKAIQMGLDPALVSRLLQEGPKAAAPILEQIVGGHGAALVKLMNESEAALSKSGQTAVEIARLTQLAISSKSGQMVIDLKAAMEIAQREAASGGTLTIGQLAIAMERSYSDVKGIVDRFGIIVPNELTTAGKRGSDGFREGISPIAPDAEAFMRAVEGSVRDFIGPLPTQITDLASQIASNWRIGTDPMPKDTEAVMYLLDQKVRGTLGELPGFTDDTANDLAVFWAMGLKPMPGDTEGTANRTASVLRDALEPLPKHAEDTAYSTVAAWLRELAKGEGGTSTETAAWAAALLEVLNPLLKGAGAEPLYVPTAGAQPFAEGGIRERHEAQIAGPGSPMRLWAEPETQGEAYIPLAQSKRKRSTGILEDVAGRFGYGLTPMAFGGVLDELGLPINPTLGEYGHLVGHTAEKTGDYAYNAARDWVIAENARKEAEAAKSGGGQPYSGGDIGSGWQQITGYLDSVGQDYTITSTDRPGDPGFHGRGKAVDMVGDMAAIFNTLAAGNPVPGINELFYDPMGYFYDEGNRASGAIGGHDDHVHAATFDKGGVLWPGWNRIYNATGKMEALVPKLTALANGGIIYEDDPYGRWDWRNMGNGQRGVWVDGHGWMLQDASGNLTPAPPNLAGQPKTPDLVDVGGGIWVPPDTAKYPVIPWGPGNPEFDRNSASSPARGQPGAVQAEDGSWVPSSFYGGAPTSSWVTPRPTTHVGSEGIGQFTPTFVDTSNFSPPAPVDLSSSPAFSAPSAGHDGAAAGALNFDDLLRAIETLVLRLDRADMQAFADAAGQRVAEAIARSPLRAFVAANDIQAATYASDWDLR